MKATDGKGVDIVLNSLAGDKLKASLRVLANNGRFLEIGKFDLYEDTPLGMSVFLKNITFHGILLEALFAVENSLLLQDLIRVLEHGIKSGFVRPLQTTVFHARDVDKAFRYMTTGNHIGKVLLKIREDFKPITVPASPRTYCDPTKAYIITGGLGGFGLELAQWLVERGAKCLILTSRFGIKSGYQKKKIYDFRKEGVDVIISKRNICSKEDTEMIIKETNGRPVGGVFHLAMVLKGGLFQNQSIQNFQSVCRPKVQGVVNLDHVTRRQCKTTLDFFVVFSSVITAIGEPGQTNYGFANSAMERICEQRRSDGFHGLAIQWGPVAHTGIFVEKIRQKDADLSGTKPQSIPSCLRALDVFLNQPDPVVSSYVMAAKFTGGRNQSDGSLTMKIKKILGVDEEEKLDPDKILEELGVDSLLNTEIKHTLENDHNISLSPKQIRESTINELQELVKKQQTKESEADKSGEQEQIKYMDLEVEYFMPPDLMAELLPKREVLKLNDVTEGTPLLVIHHVFGPAGILEHVASRVHAPVFGIQRTEDIYQHQSNMKSMALWYIEIIDTLIPDQDFYLAGYSFGAAMAQEIAVQLQERGGPIRLKSLILLDGSDTMDRIITDRLLLEDSVTDVKAKCNLQDFLALTIKDKTVALNEDLCRKTFANIERRDLPVDYEMFKRFCIFYRNVVVLLHNYKPSVMFHRNVHLFIAESTLKSLRVDPKDCLPDFTTGEVKYYTFKGRHTSFILDETGLEVAKIINSIISRD